MKMENEMKKYVQPSMDVYELKTQGALLTESQEELSRELDGFGEDNE